MIEKALQVEAEDRYQTGNEFKKSMMEVSETINRQVATGDVTVTPPPAEATLLAGSDTLPRPVPPGQRAARRPEEKQIPLGLDHRRGRSWHHRPAGDRIRAQQGVFAQWTDPDRGNPIRCPGDRRCPA